MADCVRWLASGVMGPNAATQNTTVTRRSTCEMTSTDNGLVTTECVQDITENGRQRRVRSKVTEFHPRPSPGSSGNREGSSSGHIGGQKEGSSTDHASGQKEGSSSGHIGGQKEGSSSSHVGGQKEGSSSSHVGGQKEGSSSSHVGGQKEGSSSGHVSGQKEGSSSGHVGGQVEGSSSGHVSGQIEGPSPSSAQVESPPPNDFPGQTKICPLDQKRGKMKGPSRHGQGQNLREGTVSHRRHYQPCPDAPNYYNNMSTTASPAGKVSLRGKQRTHMFARMERESLYSTRTPETASAMLKADAESERMQMAIAQSILNDLAMK